MFILLKEGVLSKNALSVSNAFLFVYLYHYLYHYYSIKSKVFYVNKNKSTNKRYQQIQLVYIFCLLDEPMIQSPLGIIHVMLRVYIQLYILTPGII